MSEKSDGPHNYHLTLEVWKRCWCLSVKFVRPMHVLSFQVQRTFRFSRQMTSVHGGWFSRNPPGVDYIISIELTQSHRLHSGTCPTESPSAGCLSRRIPKAAAGKIREQLVSLERPTGFGEHGLYPPINLRWLTDHCAQELDHSTLILLGRMWNVVYRKLPHVTPMKSLANACDATKWHLMLRF
jgi:hypothetical protein